MTLPGPRGPYGMNQKSSASPDLPPPTPLDQLPRTSDPATRALNLAGYSSLRDLVGVPRSTLLQLHGVGPKAVRIIDEELDRHGLGLG